MTLNPTKTHPSITDANDLQSICSPLKALGITYFGHAKMNELGEFSALCSHSTFFEIYLNKKYYFNDIHMAEFHQPEQYILWDIISVKDKTLEMENEFTDLGLGHTFTIYNKSESHTDYYHFASTLGNNAINQLYLNKLDVLKRFINYFTDQINQHRQLRQAYNINFSVESNNSGFLQDKLIYPEESFILSKIVSDRLYFTSDTYITKREMECLHLIATGKTFEEAANILNISPRTIKAHVTNVREKFSCDNHFQLGMLYQKLSGYWYKNE